MTDDMGIHLEDLHLKERWRECNLAHPKFQFLYLPAFWGTLAIGLMWLFKVQILSVLGAATEAEAAESAKQVAVYGSQLKDVSSKVDALTQEVRINMAFAMVQNFQNEANRLEDNPQDTAEWRLAKRKADGHLKLAIEYRDCLLAFKPNCDLIQRQIVQQ